jgi:hypothetical protein
MLPRCIALSVASWEDIGIATARFEGENHWRALMSVGSARLSEYEVHFPTEAGARSGAYLGVQMYVTITKNLVMPPLDTLEWSSREDPDEWVARFYEKPVWPSAPLKSRAAGS